MADSSTILVIDQKDALNPASRSGKTLLVSVINHLQGLLGGNKRGTNIQVFADGADPVAASGTVTLASCGAGTVVEVNGVPFTALSGSATVANNEFDISGNDTADATALKDAINNSTHASLQNLVTATSSGAVVTVSAAQKGALGNGVTIKTLGVVATGTVTYSSASGAQTCTINGVAVTAPTGASDAALATSLAANINASANALHSGHVRALARAGVCHIFAKYPGTPGNAITLAVTGTGATASGARLSGGTEASSGGARATGTVTLASAANADTVTVNGVVFTAHTNTDGADQFAIDGDDTTDATKLVRAINNSTSAGAADVIATSSGAVVTITARRGGVSGNAITLASSNGTRLAVSGARLANGAAPTTVVLSGERLASGAGGAVAVSTINL